MCTIVQFTESKVQPPKHPQSTPFSPTPPPNTHTNTPPHKLPPKIVLIFK